MACVTLREADKGREAYRHFLKKQSNHFETFLFGAIAHAHPNNLQKIAEVFPAHVFAYEEYVKTGKIKMEISDNKKLDDLKCEFEEIKALLEKEGEPKEKEELKRQLYEIARQIGELCLTRDNIKTP